MNGEIIIEFPYTWTWDFNEMGGLRLIASSEIKTHYEKLGKTVPFWFVGLSYVEISGEQYAVIPIPKHELNKE